MYNWPAVPCITDLLSPCLTDLLCPCWVWISRQSMSQPAEQTGELLLVESNQPDYLLHNFTIRSADLPISRTISYTISQLGQLLSQSFGLLATYQLWINQTAGNQRGFVFSFRIFCSLHEILNFTNIDSAWSIRQTNVKGTVPQDFRQFVWC